MTGDASRFLRVFIVAGEHSGDRLGGKLMKRSIPPDLPTSFLAGEHAALTRHLRG